MALQARDGSYGVKSSMFWVPQPGSNESGMTGYTYPAEDAEGWVWDRARADSLGRAYNFPHQVSVYVAMYHALRDNDKLHASQPAEWYLDQAARTTLGMWNVSRWYSQMGLMVGSVFRELLRDLIDEEHPLAPAVRGIMFNRTAVGVTYFSSNACKPGPGVCYNCTYGTGNATTECPTDAAHLRTRTVYQCTPWMDNPWPFGSEFSWDSTGQEESYVWGRYFGTVSPARESASGGLGKADSLANLTLSAVLAYMPSVPHWGYNGAAWSWGDTGNNAKWSDARRVAGHYRTTLNAIPMIEQWYLDPDDWYLLPPAVGAMSLHMATIDEDGASSMGFHLDPAILQLDPYSGDFGIGFYGHVHLAASIFVLHPLHGSLCFLCDASPAVDTPSAPPMPTSPSPAFLITPRDSIHRRVFLEPFGVLLELQAGRRICWNRTGSCGAVGTVGTVRVQTEPRHRINWDANRGHHISWDPNGDTVCSHS